MIRIELLFFDGCPSWRQAWTDLGLVLSETGLAAKVELRNVGTMDDRDKVGFAGSPTIRIDGTDLAGYDGPAVTACRRYEDNAGRGWPSTELVRTRLLEAADPDRRRRADGA